MIKKYEYMELNISQANMLKHLNQAGELGWQAFHKQVHKPNSPVLDNTVFTVSFWREKEPAK